MHTRAFVRVVAGAMVASGLLGAGVLADRQHREQAASICVQATVADPLPGPMTVSLEAEATRIWFHHGLELIWRQSRATRCDEVVPIVFDDYRLRRVRGVTPQTLALTVFSGRSRVIYVSAQRASRMFVRLFPSSTAAERDMRGGTLLGRIVAHELGHVLLTTTSHAESGLMRPVFGLQDVLSGDERMVALSPEQVDRLAARFLLLPRRVARSSSQGISEGLAMMAPSRG